MVSVASEGLTGWVAKGARGAAPLLRDLLFRFLNMSGPSALESSPLEVDAWASLSRSSLLTSLEEVLYSELPDNLSESFDCW